ncbi:hypothetical protein [Bacillus sp. ISL-45]|uniref:hypothetical protein n=1 Tax=Bacillus sp. ISL-45 TaxID=2819128 RepID=UPI001BEABFCF|nr:hypothetical protein [Bacillus sp. ISL-45]
MKKNFRIEFEDVAYSYSISRIDPECNRCLTIGVWSFFLASRWNERHRWQEYARKYGIDPKILEFKPTYPKLISVHDRITAKHNSGVIESERFKIGFKMNGERWTGIVYVYKGWMQDIKLLEMSNGIVTYKREAHNQTDEKLIKIVERQLLPKLVKRLDSYVQGTDWRFRR